VLLSFAQFEREVTSERIRDKIAASKRKGLWVGGMAPLGYDTAFEPSLCLSRSPFPGNGISGPEKNAPKRPADCNDAVSENEPSHGSPPIRGLSYTFRKSPVAHDCVVVDAALIEPVSTLKFPASREFSREFFEKRASECDSRI
jgi:hypothetical protein